MNLKFIHRVALACGMMAVASVASADTLTRMVVWGTDGSRVNYDLVESPSVKFVGEDLSISTGAVTDIRIPMSSVSHITYETTTVTGVEDLIGDDTCADFSEGNLVFTLAEGDNTIEIVNMQGAVIVSTTLRGNGERVYPLTGLQPGAYVVKFNGLTYKVIKR